MVYLPPTWERLFNNECKELDEIVLVLQSRIQKGFTIVPPLNLLMEPFYLTRLDNLVVMILSEYRVVSYSHRWCKQGVMCLNPCFTKELLTPSLGSLAPIRSHESLWKHFARQVIKECSSRHGVIFLLMGDKACAFDNYIDGTKNVVLTTSQKDPSQHLKMINDILIGANREPIEW